MRTCLLTILLVSTLGLQGLAQRDTTKLWIFGANQYLGKVLDIHPFFPETTGAQATEITASYYANGSRPWHEHFGYPEVGYSLSHAWLGNPDTLGNAITGYAFMSLNNPLFGPLSYKVRLGTGLAGFTKPFHAIDNPGNLVIGSRVTWAVHVGAKLVYSPNAFLHFNAGASFWHYSNAHMDVPNIGANNVYYSFGVEVSTRDKFSVLNKETVHPEKKIRVNLFSGLGLQEVEGTVYPSDGPKYPVYFGDVYVTKRISGRSRAGVGLNYNYYPAFYEYIVSQEIYSDKQKWRSSKIVLYAGHEFMLGRLSMLLSLGWNVHYPLRHEQIDAGIIERKFTHLHLSNNLGLNYYFKKADVSTKYSPFIGLGVKAIGGKADYLQIRTGFVL